MDDFTLEKMKIDERLRSVEIQLARVVSHLESEAGTITRITDPISQILQRHDKILFGNGDSGIIIRVNRLEQTATDQKESVDMHKKIVYGSIMGLFLEHLRHILFSK